jgi:DNA-binding response OmpR family regulator
VEVLASLLEDEGYCVLRAHDGVAALAIIRRDRPALLLTDNAMPAMSGVELVAYLHAHPHLAISVILMSAVTPVLMPPRTSFIAKPFDIEDVLAKVGAVLR